MSQISKNRSLWIFGVTQTMASWAASAGSSWLLQCKGTDLTVHDVCAVRTFTEFIPTRPLWWGTWRVGGSAGTLVRAATLWASSASTSGRVSALRMVCCSFCSASSSFSWSCRFLSSVYDKQTKSKQSLSTSKARLGYIPVSGVCFQLHKVKRVGRNKTGGQGDRQRGTKGDGREGMGRKWGREHS